VIQIPVEPANQEVIYQSEDPGGTDSVVGSNVSEDSDLRRHANIRCQELAEQGRKWSSSHPESERMEQEFVTSVRCVSISVLGHLKCVKFDEDGAPG
jgi:hypothetical protein